MYSEWHDGSILIPIGPRVTTGAGAEQAHLGAGDRRLDLGRDHDQQAMHKRQAGGISHGWRRLSRLSPPGSR